MAAEGRMPAATMAYAPVDEAGRRRRIRRSALVFAAIAAAFYVGFIAMMLVRASR